jgi:hypothetical protein
MTTIKKTTLFILNLIVLDYTLAVDMLTTSIIKKDERPILIMFGTVCGIVDLLILIAYRS